MKYLYLLLVIIILLLAGAGYIYYTNSQAHDNILDSITVFESYLRNKEYDTAQVVYEDANSTLKANYNITLDTYINQYISGIDTEAEAEDILNDLYDIQLIGYTNEEISRMINQYESILTSNYAFETGLSLYRENKFDEALEIFSEVIESDENYETAMSIIEDHHNHQKVFDEAKEANSFGRNPLPNAVANNDEYMFIPYIDDNAYCILKIKKGSYLTYVFPIISTNYPSEIDNLNIIGDYIYFTLNANYTTEEDYSGIYKIKTDGSALQKVSDEKLREFIIRGDTFYGLTIDGELKSYDSRFVGEELIYEGDIEYFQFSDGGIYLGISQSEEINPDIEYIKWDYEEIEVISSQYSKNRKYYVFDEGNLVCFDYGGNNEWIYLMTPEYKNQHVKIDDIYEVYGIVDGTIIYTIIGDYYQECINIYMIERYKNSEIASTDFFSPMVLGINYEDSGIVVQKNNELYITGLDFTLDKAIVIPSVKSDVLASNQDTIINYGIDENSQGKNWDWEYSSDDTKINIDLRYIENIEINMYFVEIISDNQNILNILNKDELSTDGLSFGVSVDIGNTTEDTNAEDSTITNSVIASDGLVIDTDGVLNLYSATNMISKDIYTYDNVHISIERGFAVLKDCIVQEIAEKAGNYIAIGQIKQGHYIILAVDATDEDNKAITPYQCGRLLGEMGCINGYCYNNSNISILLDNNVIFDNGNETADDCRYLVIK